MVKDSSDSERGNLLLPLCMVFYLYFTDRIIHTMVYDTLSLRGRK